MSNRIIAVFLVLLMTAAVLSSCGNDEVPSRTLTLEGYYVAGNTGSHIIVTEETEGVWSPVVMTEVDDAVIVPAWSELNSGDRIRVTCDLIAETWPAQTNIYTLEKLSDGSPSDVPEEIMSRLAESGFAEEETDEPTTSETDSDINICFMLSGLDYQDYTCDGLPEFTITAPGGEVYSVNVTDGWVWLDGAREAALPDELGQWILEHQNEPMIERTKYFTEEAE